MLRNWVEKFPPHATIILELMRSQNKIKGQTYKRRKNMEFTAIECCVMAKNLDVFKRLDKFLMNQ